jgi:hypothetical protein
MDCRTARHLLEFSRPCASELDDDDQDALNGHLAICPDCDSMARAEREADQHLGQAIREVPIPLGLRERLLRRLQDEREAWKRRLLVRGVRIVIASAAVVLIAWFGLSFWRKNHLPRPSAEQLAETALLRHHDGAPDYEEAEAWFRKNGLPVVAPEDLKEQFLFSYFLGDLPKVGKRLPCLLFVRTDDQGRLAQLAYVYILSGKQFDLGALSADYLWPSGWRFKAEVWRRGEFAYVIVYSGDNLKPMLRPEKNPSRS